MSIHRFLCLLCYYCRMIDFEVRGAIFDVDDTLLNNYPDTVENGLHERSRLDAAHAAGREFAIPGLQELTPQQSLDAFLTAPVHTLESAVWNMLRMAGEADSDVINPENPVFERIVMLKNILHRQVLLDYGEEVPGAVAFVKALAASGLQNKLAVASTAVRRDVNLFFEMTGLDEYFPNERIKTKESITHPKPHPEVFDRAFASLGLPEADRAQVCAFEDDPRGIMAAKAAGLYVCAITTRFDAESLRGLEVPPDFVADSYAEFAQHFGLSL
jgi:beta-phosphoglucomutase-like phosphatase (HAD superfamily)